MIEVKYVAITEAFRDILADESRDKGWMLWEKELRAAPQAEVKRRDIPHGELVAEVVMRYDLDVGDGSEVGELPDRVLRALLTKIGVETTEVCR